MTNQLSHFGLIEYIMHQSHLKKPLRKTKMFLGCRVSNCHLTNDWNYHGSNETDKFDAVIFPLIKMMSKTAIAKAEL